MEIEKHDYINGQTPSELDKHRGDQEDVDEHGTQQERKKRPLMVIVSHVAGGPNTEKIGEKADHLLEKGILKIRSGIATPPAVGAISRDEASTLRNDPGNEHGKGGGQNETGWATKRALGNRGEGANFVTVS